MDKNICTVINIELGLKGVWERKVFRKTLNGLLLYCPENQFIDIGGIHLRVKYYEIGIYKDSIEAWIDIRELDLEDKEVLEEWRKTLLKCGFKEITK